MVTLHKSTEQIVRIFPRFKEKDIQYVPASEKVLRIYCKEFFTGYIFIPDPNSGVYGLGFGALLGPLNLSVNTIINQLVDAGTLSVLQGGFLSSNLQLTAGNMEWEPGEWKIVNSYGNDIRQSIVPLPAAPPSTVLLSLLQLLEQASMKIASVTDILSGEVPGQNTKATVAMNAVEQGLKLFTSIYKRCHTAQSKEMLKIQRLNAEYLNEREYLDILDTEVDGGQEIHRNDYNMDDYDIILSADPNVSSDQQRLLKVQALFDVLPLGAVNPTEVTKQYLEATEQPNVEQLMTMPPARPNPELVMQEVELKHKISKESEELVHRKRMEYWDRQLRSIEVDLKALDTRTTAILNLAKAEGEEEGRQLGELRNYLDQVRAQEEQLMQKKRDVIDQQFKEEQVALQREQAAAQQQQQNNNQQQ
jgi:chaperonin GroES